MIVDNNPKLSLVLPIGLVLPASMLAGWLVANVLGSSSQALLYALVGIVVLLVGGFLFVGPGLAKKPLAELTFIVIFVMVYLLGGLIHMLHVIPYRMNLLALLVLPLLLLYRRVKWGPAFFAYGGLTFIVCLSALYNQTSLVQTGLFLRTVIFSFSIYTLVQIYLCERNIASIVRWCVLIAVMQLPVVVFQQAFFDQLPASVTAGSSFQDFDFGTFSFKTDSAMTSFLIMNVIFLLFDKKHVCVVNPKYRYHIALWLTLTVLIVNSHLSKLVIALVWAAYLLAGPRLKPILLMLLAFGLIVGVLATVGELGQVAADFRDALSGNLSTAGRVRTAYLIGRRGGGLLVRLEVRVIDLLYAVRGNLRMDAQEAYLSGRGYRGSAIAYYLSKPISLLGDGPSEYYDVIDRVLLRGNTGHIFTFYSEVGLLGTVASFLVIYLVARERQRRLTLVNGLYLFAMVAMSVAVDVLNNISVFLTYCIFVSSNSLILAGKPADLDQAVVTPEAALHEPIGTV